MKKTQELSIEEILASIRGIVQNTSGSKSGGKENSEDILELTELGFDDEDRDDEASDLLSESVMEEASEALRDFADQTSKIDHYSLRSGNEKTIEELMLEILRPEIKKWLDTNLPSIVRQLVEREIKRLTPKG